MLLAECWRLATSSRLFYYFNEMTMLQSLSVSSNWWFPFLILPYSSFHWKHWKLDIIVYWVIGAGCQIEKGLKLSPTPPNCSKDFRKMLPLLISINSPNLVDKWVVVQKIYSKMHPVSCNNTHHDVTDLVNHGIVKKTKTLISREQNITFPWNKKILKLCLWLHILRSYRFVAEVTFNWNDVFFEFYSMLLGNRVREKNIA